MLGFLSVGRSSPGAPSGGVSGQRWSSRRKSSPKIFSGNRGGLMSMKDSKYEGRLVRVR